MNRILLFQVITTTCTAINMVISSEIMLCSYPSTGLGPGLCSLTSQTHFTKREGSGELGVPEQCNHAGFK